MNEFDALVTTLLGFGSIFSLLLCAVGMFFIFAVIALPFYVISINGKMKQLVNINKEMSSKLSSIRSSNAAAKVVSNKSN